MTVPDEVLRHIPDDVELVTDDVSPADWVANALQEAGFARGVRSLIPPAFGAYARVFHPAEVGDRGSARPATWAEVAERTGRTLSAESSFEELATPIGYAGPITYRGDSIDPAVERPEEGTLDAGLARVLVEILRDFTATPDRCWHCLWVGFGFLHPGASGPLRRVRFPRFMRAEVALTRRLGNLRGLVSRRFRPRRRLEDLLPMVHAPGRDYLLLRGPIDAVVSFTGYPVRQTPNIWWPEDRAWCVATEIDLDSTFIGGSEECIARILADDRLEALRTHADGGWWGSRDPRDA